MSLAQTFRGLSETTPICHSLWIGCKNVGPIAMIEILEVYAVGKGITNGYLIRVISLSIKCIDASCVL
jgi:hypothetical protein